MLLGGSQTFSNSTMLYGSAGTIIGSNPSAQYPLDVNYSSKTHRQFSVGAAGAHTIKTPNLENVSTVNIQYTGAFKRKKSQNLIPPQNFQHSNTQFEASNTLVWKPNGKNSQIRPFVETDYRFNLNQEKGNGFIPDIPNKHEATVGGGVIIQPKKVNFNAVLGANYRKTFENTPTFERQTGQWDVFAGGQYYFNQE